MNLSKKQRKAISTISTIAMIWFMLAVNRSIRVDEYSNIVESLSSVEQLGDCSIKTDIERDWPFNWTPASMFVQVADNVQKTSIYTSQFGSPPDRKQLSPGYFQYHFRWSKRLENGNLEVSYMDVQIDRSDKVNNVGLVVCPNYPSDNYNWNDLDKKMCLEQIKVIECS
jgi:hypothetical protein